MDTRTHTHAAMHACIYARTHPPILTGSLLRPSLYIAACLQGRFELPARPPWRRQPTRLPCWLQSSSAAAARQLGAMDPCLVLLSARYHVVYRRFFAFSAFRLGSGTYLDAPLPRLCWWPGLRRIQRRVSVTPAFFPKTGTDGGFHALH